MDLVCLLGINPLCARTAIYLHHILDRYVLKGAHKQKCFFWTGTPVAQFVLLK